MRRVAVLLVIGLSACVQTAPVASNGSPTSASQTAPASPASSAPATECRLPVWWQDSSTTDIHAGLLAIPGGGITEPQTLSPTTDSSALSSFQFFGGTYLGAAGGWKRLNRALVSPDGTRYAYWNGSGTDTDSVHVLDLSTGADRVIYQGAVLYWPIAWETDGIYLVDAIAPRQGAFQGLFKLDPGGGSPPQPVTGADRHMYQWGWVLVADGAAWGIDNTASGSDYSYSVIRLDLTTFQTATWFGPTSTMFWPLGVDLQHRLYVGDAQQLERVDSGGGTAQLTSPGSDAIYANQGPGEVSGFVADSRGVWLDGIGGVWRYADAATGVEYPAGPPDATVYPAGSCA